VASIDLTAQDHWDIRQVLSYYAHLVDSGEWVALGEVFSENALIETSSGVFTGPGCVREFETGDSHHTLNTVIRAGESDGIAIAWSRFILVAAEGTAAGGDYLDTLGRGDDGWRITHRRVTERNRTRPAGEYSSAGAEDFASWRVRS
jgi:hypothetical protein